MMMVVVAAWTRPLCECRCVAPVRRKLESEARGHKSACEEAETCG